MDETIKKNGRFEQLQHQIRLLEEWGLELDKERQRGMQKLFVSMFQNAFSKHHFRRRGTSFNSYVREIKSDYQTLTASRHEPSQIWLMQNLESKITALFKVMHHYDAQFQKRRQYKNHLQHYVESLSKSRNDHKTDLEIVLQKRKEQLRQCEKQIDLLKKNLKSATEQKHYFELETQRASLAREVTKYQERIAQLTKLGISTELQNRRKN